MWRNRQAGLDELDRVAVAAVDEREPGQQLEGPGHDLLMAAFPAELERRVPGGLGRLTVAEVELEAGQQKREPTAGHDQVPVLGEREAAGEELADVPELALHPRRQQGRHCVG